MVNGMQTPPSFPSEFSIYPLSLFSLPSATSSGPPGCALQAVNGLRLSGQGQRVGRSCCCVRALGSGEGSRQEPTVLP